MLRLLTAVVLLLMWCGCNRTPDVPLFDDAPHVSARDPIERLGDDALSDAPRFGKLELLDPADRSKGVRFVGVQWAPDGPADDTGRGGWSAWTYRAEDPQLRSYRLVVSVPDPAHPPDRQFALIARVQKLESGAWRKFGPQKWWRLDGAVDELFYFSEVPPHRATNWWDADGVKIVSEIMGGQYSPEILAFDRPIEPDAEISEAQSRADLEKLLNARTDAELIRVRWPNILRKLKRIDLLLTSPPIETWYDLAEDPGEWSTCGVLTRRDPQLKMDDATDELFGLLHELRLVDNAYDIVQSLPDTTSGRSGPIEWRYVDRSDDTHFRVAIQFRLRGP